MQHLHGRAVLARLLLLDDVADDGVILHHFDAGHLMCVYVCVCVCVCVYVCVCVCMCKLTYMQIYSKKCNLCPRRNIAQLKPFR